MPSVAYIRRISSSGTTKTVAPPWVTSVGSQFASIPPSGSAGTFSVRGTPDAKRTIQEVALATFAAHDLPAGMEPSINADYVLEPQTFSFDPASLTPKWIDRQDA